LLLASVLSELQGILNWHVLRLAFSSPSRDLIQSHEAGIARKNQRNR
jgi:hypothetical protein